MLTIQVSIEDGFDEETSEFVSVKSETLELEHSLVSLSKWESKWEKPFLDKNTEKTTEMFLDYIRFMILNDYEESTLNKLTQENINEISEYINSKQTATWFNEISDNPSSRGPKVSGKIVTSDLIYYWMVALTIPFECQTWHLNRLITLIRITELENRPKKNMPKKESMSRHRALNQARRAKSGRG